MILPVTHSAEEVAAAVGKTSSWVKAEARAGRLPSVKVGRTRRFRAEDVSAFLAERTQARPVVQVVGLAPRSRRRSA